MKRIRRWATDHPWLPTFGVVLAYGVVAYVSGWFDGFADALGEHRGRRR